MKKHIYTLLLALIAVISFFSLSATPSYAGCNDPALCDAPPGSCSTTCNGGQPCKINNGGWTTPQCPADCTCRNVNTGQPINASCSINGALCGVSGTTYTSGTSYGECFCDIPDTCENQSPVPTCSETTWASCCTPGSPAPSGSGGPSLYCGDGIQSPEIGENCITCESDYGVCSPPTPPPATPPPPGSPTPPPPTPPPFCGNTICDGTDNCTNCALDCGACPDSCPDSQCTGFETCESCSADCGVCILAGDQPWWQSQNGTVFAGASNGTAIQSQIFDTFCLAPDCIALLITPDSTDAVESEGIAITGGGGITTNGYTNTNSSEAVGSTATRFKENYQFFYRNSGLGLAPASDFSGQEGDIQKPSSSKVAYYHQGNLTLQSLWVVSSGESFTIFVDGNLTISDPASVGQLIDVAQGGFLAFVVSGNITVSSDVGNATLTTTTPNIEGVFVADGTIAIESLGAGLGDERFIGEGTFVGWTSVDLQRDFADGAGGEVNNQDTPTEQFIYRPDFVVNVPDILTKNHTIWQESN